MGLQALGSSALCDLTAKPFIYARNDREEDALSEWRGKCKATRANQNNREGIMKRYVLAVLSLMFVTHRLYGQIYGANSGMIVTNVTAGSSLPVTVKFSASIRELDGTSPAGVRGISFAIYKEQNGGVPLWMETQSVVLDQQGRFTVLLGSTRNEGVPSSIFVNGEPQWIGLTLDDGVERPRIALSSVPYAFKSVDADTLGGKTSDQFVSQQQLASLLSTLKLPTPILFPAPPPISLPVFAPSLIDASAAFAKLTGNNVFSGSETFEAGIDMPASIPQSNTANTFDSAPMDFESSSPGLQAGTTTTQRFRWISQSLAATGPGPTASLSLLFGVNGATPTSTGLSVNSDGTINFAPGQQFGVNVGSVMSGGSNASNAGATGSNSPIVNTGDYSFVQQPQNANAILVGPNTITMTPCPRGVNGTDAWHYLYISGTGTPEVVLLTGGTCLSHAAGGTIEFTAQYAHPLGYSIGTATAGIQEAIIGADVIQTAGNISRQVMIDPGAHLLRARVSIRSSSITIMSSGATLTCAMSDTCIMAGDPSNGDEFQAIVLQGLRVAPGVKAGTWPAVEDDAQGSQINNLGPAASPIQGSSFGSLVQIDNDQAAVINGLSTTLNYSWGRCDTTFCSTAIVGPGPYSRNAGVLWVQNSNISLQCTGNGIDNQDGNGLRVTNSVIQGYAQFGIRASTAYILDTVNLTGVTEEEDGYCNPLGTGSAGLIVEGGQATTSASPSAGLIPQYANTGSLGYFYYVVVKSSLWGTSSAYLAGYANTNGSGPIKVLWNQIGTVGTITYDVLRITGDGGPDMVAPYGTGQFAVATGIPITQCSNNVCSVIDDAASTPASYTVNNQTLYWPSLKLWPGSVILTSSVDTGNSGGGNPTTYFTDQLPRQGSIVNSAGDYYPSVFAQECNPQGGGSAIWMQCQGGNSVGNDYPPVVGTLFQLTTSFYGGEGLKGRLIFETPPGAYVPPTHIITLSDSNTDKTLSTPGNRPPWDPNDSYIGTDGGYIPSKMQISFGAAVAISRYIANPGDGVNYQERLTATEEQYRVPVQLASVAFASLPNLSDGTVLYCSDCMNVTDDGAAFDSNATAGGHGTNVLHENGHWRVH